MRPRLALWIGLSCGAVACSGDRGASRPPDPPTDRSGGTGSDDTAGGTTETSETGTLPPAPGGQIQWAAAFGGPGDEIVAGLAVRADGSVAVAGEGGSGVVFDAGLPTEVQLSGSAPQAFWALWSPDGALRTVVSAADGPGEVGRAQGIVEGIEGDLYVVGQISGPATFGAQALSPPTPEALFLARYTDDGTLRWLRDAPCDGSCRIVSVESFEDGSLLVGGAFTGTLLLGPGDPRQAVLTSVGDTEDGFIAHYTAGGLILTGLHVPSEGGSVVTAMEREASGNILAAVALSGRTTLGRAGDPGRVVLDAPGEGSQVAVARYLLDASLDAVLPLGGVGDDVPRGLWATDDGGFALAGGFAGSLVGDGLALQSTAGTDAMLLRYSAAWALTWAAQIGGGGDDLGVAVTGSDDGQLWLSGELCAGADRCSASLGVGGADPVTIDGLSGSTSFIGAFDAGGVPGWARIVGGGASAAVGLGVDASGVRLLASRFEDQVIVGEGGPDAVVLTSRGGIDGLVVSVQP